MSVSPDGKELVVHDGARLRCNIDQSTWAGIACEAAGRNLTHPEGAHYLPNGGPYRPTCPDHPS
jgi:hypothetical protein